MKRSKTYAHGKHAVTQAKEFAPQAVLKVFEDERGAPVAQISLSRLLKTYADFIASLAVTPDTMVVMLAGVEDPHNVGALIRSAAAFGAAGVLLPTVGQAPITDAVLKVSAGMAFRVPLVVIEGYQQTLSDLRKRGFCIAALEQGAPAPLSAAGFEKPTVLVLGNEGQGLPPAVRPLVDLSLAIPMHPRAESLNVAAAGAAALFAWSVRHPGALQK
ncbi:MAG: RNA methyltransferase [Patescibacteria group bacterium]